MTSNALTIRAPDGPINQIHKSSATAKHHFLACSVIPMTQFPPPFRTNEWEPNFARDCRWRSSR
jgi:hypothetical protein